MRTSHSLRNSAISGPDGIPMSIVDNPEIENWLRRRRASDGRPDPKGYMRLLRVEGYRGNITTEDIKQYFRVRFGDNV